MYVLYQMFPETTGKLFGNFCAPYHIVVIKVVVMLHIYKVQIYGYKQAF